VPVLLLLLLLLLLLYLEDVYSAGAAGCTEEAINVVSIECIVREGEAVDGVGEK
jgi:hypothetical protein